MQDSNESIYSTVHSSDLQSNKLIWSKKDKIFNDRFRSSLFTAINTCTYWYFSLIFMKIRISICFLYTLQHTIMVSRTDNLSPINNKRIILHLNRWMVPEWHNFTPNGLLRRVLRPNSWKYNFVEVSRHNLDSYQTWGFRFQCLHYKPVSNHFCSRGGVISVSRGGCE